MCFNRNLKTESCYAAATFTPAAPGLPTILFKSYPTSKMEIVSLNSCTLPGYLSSSAARMRLFENESCIYFHSDRFAANSADAREPKDLCPELA